MIKPHDTGWYWTMGKSKKAHWFKDPHWTGPLCGTPSGISPCAERNEAPDSAHCQQCQRRLAKVQP
jgi:hypothetical protein